MQDEIPLTGKKSERHALTLAPGNGLTSLSVFQVDQPHQTTLVQTAEATASHARTDASLQGCAIGKGDVAMFTQWLNQSSYDQTEPTIPTLLKPPQQDLYQIVLVDHITSQKASRLALCQEATQDMAHIAHISPVAWQHSNFYGRYECTKASEPINMEEIVEALAHHPTISVWMKEMPG